MSSPLLALASTLLALTLALLSASLMLKTGFLMSVVDRPNDRSLHVKPTPRVGGIPLLVGALSAGLLQASLLRTDLLLALYPGVLVLAVIGALDDRQGLRARVRLAFQLGAAIWAVFSLRTVIAQVAWLDAPWGYVVLVLGITWLANLYNFMDGSDGLAGGMAAWGFGTLGLLSALSGDLALAGLSGAFAGASLGFLRFNWNPAKMFMGDVGSVALGFAAAVLGLYGFARGLWPAWTPVIAFWPFIFDATLTLFRRLARGERVWVAHREHLYQKLVRLGWGHKRTAWVEFAAMAVCSALCFASRTLSVRGGLALGVVLLVTSALCAWSVERAWRVSRTQPAPSH